MTEGITRLEKKRFDSPDETQSPFEKGRIEVVTLGGLAFSRLTVEPGWRWSRHVKPIAGTDSCQKYHVMYVLAGRQRVVMEDGTELGLEPGDVAVIPPGHDPRVEGDEPNVLLELSGLLSGSDAITRLEKKRFDSPDETRRPFAKGTIEVVTLGGLAFTRETLEPGWRWSEHVKPTVGTERCQKYHVKYILSGRQHVVMEDGTELVLGPGDVAVMPPGHDAWVEGDEPNVLLELIGLVGHA